MPNNARPEPKIPDHEVLRKIGGGAYGEVWLARGVTGAMRAVKVVWHDDFEDEREFDREFQGILKYEPISRDHPGLVHILHVGRGDDGDDSESFYYYVMELGDDVETGREINPVEYEARTLRSEMKSAEGDPLDTRFCVEVGRRLAEGLDHLHGNGLAHRDVKPANVIFVDGKAKLADIGLVALRGQRTFVGTEGFVPPEGPGSAQADVYSLGKVLYEMATGMDRLDFPELPDELPEGDELKLWRSLNGVICDVCEPKISQRKLTTAAMLATELHRLERGRRRPIRVNPGLVLGILVAALLVAGGWQFLTMPPLVITTGLEEEDPFVPPVTETGLVAVTSNPPGAEVYNMDGAYLKDTPLRPMRMPVGTMVEFDFRLDGYQIMRAGGIVTKDGLVIEPTLRIDAPPVPGDPWEDELGMTYHPEQEYHVSNYYVGEDEWDQYLMETGRKGGQIAELSQNGRKTRVVLAMPKEAREFMDWLTGHCRDGYLTVDHKMEERIDQKRDLSKMNQEWVKKGMRPFWSVVRYIPPARIMITSTPPGAGVYLNGVLRGQTPLLQEDDHVGVWVAPGKVRLMVKAEGFKLYEKTLDLRPDEQWEEPLHIELVKNQGVIFGIPWQNSLGMSLQPVGDELMVSAWETRLQDYDAYLDDPETEVPEPPPPGFDQGPDHPVVSVSRKDVVGFCKWLTKIERKRDRISENHEYRLPTDLEWSMLNDLNDERNDWPMDRDVEEGGYPWGDEDDWPPPARTANYSDVTRFGNGGVPERQTILGYEDGFVYTSPVASFKPNRLGLFDLGGNAQEWVSDDYNSTGLYGVTRGGGWNSYQQDNLRIAARNYVSLREDFREKFYGFRVVLAKLPEERENGEPSVEDLDTLP
jgi:formylglycine-generating enzyme required for sulfatase activity